MILLDSSVNRCVFYRLESVNGFQSGIKGLFNLLFIMLHAISNTYYTFFLVGWFLFFKRDIRRFIIVV